MGKELSPSFPGDRDKKGRMERPGKDTSGPCLGRVPAKKADFPETGAEIDIAATVESALAAKTESR